MFRTRVFGGTPDAFHLACEYGPAHVPGHGSSSIPTPVALAPMELTWTSAEPEAQVVERLVQRQSALLLAHADERVAVQLSWEPIPHAADFPQQHLRVQLHTTSAPPVLRSLHFTRTAGSGSCPESLVTALLSQLDLSTVWKLRASEGFPPHFWASCTEAGNWGSLFNLNLSSCGLVSLPGAIGQLVSLHVLRLNHNKLTSLPHELGLLSELEVLSVNNNQLTTLPGELRHCSSLRELHLESNRLVTPLLDLTHATALESLQLFGNPLEYLPELAPAVGLRSLSLANVRILADKSYSRWEVEVAAGSSSYTSMVIGSRSHKLQPLFNLVFRRSSVQHPLLAGAMSRLMEEPCNLELLVREDVALQQLVLAAMGNNALVVQQAVKILSAVGGYAGAAKRLVKHNVVRAITGMLASGQQSLQLSGLRVLSSLAAGAAEGELPGEVLVPTALLDRLLDLIRHEDTHTEVRCAALHALGNSAFDASNRRRYLQSPGLMQLLVMLAAMPDTAAPTTQKLAAQHPAAAAGTAEGPQGATTEAAAADSSTGAPRRLQHTGQQQEQQQREQQQEQAGPSTPQPAQSAQAAAAAATEHAGSPPSVVPLAPSPHSSSQAAAAAEASASPPTLTMSRAPSATGAAAPQPDSGSSGSSGSKYTGSPNAAPTAAAGAARGEPPAGNATTSGRPLSPPHKAMAAAAGAAAAAAAAGEGLSGAVKSRDHSATDSPPAAAAATAAAGAKEAPSADLAAAADAIIPKRRLVSVNNPAKLQAIRLLGILGQNEQVRIALGQPPIRGRGLRVLAMDGGGMKGMAMVELLRQLERRAGAPIWSLFDVIGGTSTGGLLAVSLGLLRLNLEACQEIYTSLGNKVFNQSTAAVQEDAGWRDNLYRMYTTSSTNMRVAVYGSKHDAANYEELLRRFCAVTELGCASDRLIDTAVMGGPKVFVVATLASTRPAAPFAFRNYELPDEAAHIAEQLSACAGSCKHHVWEAVRASSAAPYYFDDFITADGKRFQDGATTANNPTVIALQQARLLYPQLPVDCVVSLGCGNEPSSDRSKGLSSVIDTGAVLLESACSTDRVHEALATTLQLVPGCQYFRFNALDARCNMELDDIRTESWTRLMSATSDYCSQPAVAAQFDRLAALLKQGSAAAAAGGGTAAAAGGLDAAAGISSRRGTAVQGPGGQHRHVAGWAPKPGKALGVSSPLQQQQQQQQGQGEDQTWQQQQRQGGLFGLGLSLPSTQRQQQAAAAAEEASMQPAVLHALQQSAANGAPSSAPRLLFQKGLLLVQAPRQLPATAAAAAAAQGVSLSALLQQDLVAQLLAAALPQELLFTCDVSAAADAAAAAHAAACNSGVHQTHTDLFAGQHLKLGQRQHQQQQSQQQQQQGIRLMDSVAVGPTAGKVSQGVHSHSHSASSSPRHHFGATKHASIGPHIGPSHGPHAAAAAAGGGAGHKLQQRASDTGGTASLSSPKPSSWFDYIFPWQQGGSGSASSSPQHTGGSSSRGGGAAGGAAGGAGGGVNALAAAGSAAAGAAGTVGNGRLPSGAWASSGTSSAAADGWLGNGSSTHNSSNRSPSTTTSKTAGHSSYRREPGDAVPSAGHGSLPAVQSLPDLLPAGTTSSPTQQEAVSSGGGLTGTQLLKIRSLPPQQLHHHQQLQQQGAADGAALVYNSSSNNSSPVQTSGGAGAATKQQLRSHNSTSHQAAATATALTGVGTHGSSSSHQQQQQQWGEAAGRGGAASAVLSEALRQQLLSTAGRVGVVHLALHACEAGLVAGWQQRLAAVVEPGPEAQELLAFLAAAADEAAGSRDRNSSSSSLSQLVASQGPLLRGPQGAVVAVLGQQQVLAPLPAPPSARTAAVAGSAAAATAGSKQALTQFVSSWLLQLTLPDSARLLGVAEVWPLLAQLQQLIVVSSSCLPKALVHVLLRGGVAAVVCGADPGEVSGLDASDVAEFFRVFYAEGLWRGLDVVEALQAAVAAVPAVGDTAYECYQLM